MLLSLGSIGKFAKLNIAVVFQYDLFVPTGQLYRHSESVVRFMKTTPVYQTCAMEHENRACMKI